MLLDHISEFHILFLLVNLSFLLPLFILPVVPFFTSSDYGDYFCEAEVTSDFGTSSSVSGGFQFGASFNVTDSFQFGTYFN